MTEPTSGDEAKAAKARAERKLRETEATEARVDKLMARLDKVREENNFLFRLEALFKGV
jgi:hypothetical protein